MASRHALEKLHYPPIPNRGALIGPSVGIQDNSGRIFFSAFSTVHTFSTGRMIPWQQALRLPFVHWLERMFYFVAEPSRDSELFFAGLVSIIVPS